MFSLEEALFLEAVLLDHLVQQNLVNTISMRLVSGNMHMKRTEISDSDHKWKTVRSSFFNSVIVHCIVDKIGGDPNCGLFAIFDGHGGK